MVASDAVRPARYFWESWPLYAGAACSRVAAFFSAPPQRAQLWNPKGVAFDESHFGGFNENYLSGTYFFDIHPPLGKLTIAAYSHLMGYRAGICSFESNTMYSPRCQYLIPRQITAFFGSLVPIVVYGVAREMRLSRPGAFFAGLLLVVDVMNVIEARYGCTSARWHCVCGLSTAKTAALLLDMHLALFAL
jgi:dolichyl-phosphate-mannose--protein O-mannosyl transferase